MKKHSNEETPIPSMSILTQYIKDLSFEATEVARQSIEETPHLQINMQVQTSDIEKNIHAISLETKASALLKASPLFVLELTYVGIFSIENLPENMLPLALYVECPRLLFPFVRSIIAHLTGDGGFPPLYLAPVNFMEMYEKRQASKETDAPAS
ncbi:MAG: protein-export chaperone SecB [Holosporales bacterium]|jgi:preprotein translocase subunit SecB|nr:protein-export chaperone SecB [Holosporales bacterium]